MFWILVCMLDISWDCNKHLTWVVCHQQHPTLLHIKKANADSELLSHLELNHQHSLRHVGIQGPEKIAVFFPLFRCIFGPWKFQVVFRHSHAKVLGSYLLHICPFWREGFLLCGSAWRFLFFFRVKDFSLRGEGDESVQIVKPPEPNCYFWFWAIGIKMSLLVACL